MQEKITCKHCRKKKSKIHVAKTSSTVAIRPVNKRAKQLGKINAGKRIPATKHGAKNPNNGGGKNVLPTNIKTNTAPPIPITLKPID